MVTKKLFVEGGGDTRDLEDECRKGFRMFLENAGCTGKMPRIVACGGRNQTVDRFNTAVTRPEQGVRPFLLIDSEIPVALQNDCSSNPENAKPWDHLQNQEAGAFVKPQGAGNDQCHLMVQLMESWFLADPSAIQKVIGKHFVNTQVQHSGNIESISKAQVMSWMESSTGKRYSKGKHSFKILTKLDPIKVQKVSPWAKRWVEEMQREPKS